MTPLPSYPAPRRSGFPAGAPLTSPFRGARGHASVTALGRPRVRVPESGLRPNWASRARAAHGFGGTSPRLLVRLRDGPRPCVCPGAGLGPFSVPGPPDGPRFLSRHHSSPCACPRLGPAAARRGGLGPGAGAGPGLFLSDGSGAHGSPKYFSWPDCCPRPETIRGQQPTTSFLGRWPSSRTGRRQLTWAHAHLPSGGPQRAHLPLAARGRSWCQQREWEWEWVG